MAFMRRSAPRRVSSSGVNTAAGTPVILPANVGPMAFTQDSPDPDPARPLAEARRLADELRRIINRLALVRPPAGDSALAADVASDFADRLESMRARSASWEGSEGGLEAG